jgi:hypothetical protein
MKVAADTAYGLLYLRATQGTLLSHPPYKDPKIGSQTISTTGLILCRKQVGVNTEVSRSLLTLVHIMYLLLFLFLLARRSQQVLCLGLERGLKPLPNELLVIIIKNQFN